MISKKDLKTGDLIGVAGVESDWGEAIMASSKRKIYTIYDHVGMIEKAQNQIFVWNANPHNGVAREKLSDFIQREEKQISKTFSVFRLKEDLKIDFSSVLSKMTRLLGLPYNFSFIQSDQAYYCSDFIARTYPKGIFALEPMKFVGDYWTHYYEKLSLEIPQGLLGINPNDLFAADFIDEMGELGRS